MFYLFMVIIRFMNYTVCGTSPCNGKVYLTSMKTSTLIILSHLLSTCKLNLGIELISSEALLVVTAVIVINDEKVCELGFFQC